MALRPSTRYPAQTDADAAYPHGKARNAGTFQDGTGTPLERDWLNDIFGLQQALLVAAGITPSDTPDNADTSQYLDAIRIVAERVAIAHDLATRALQLREVYSSVAMGGLQNSMAAVAGRTPGHATIAIKSGTSGVSHVWDWSFRDPEGAVVSITGPVCGAARVPGGLRVLAIGTGGNRCSYSDDEGATWNAGSDLGATPQDIVYNVTHTRFMVTFASGVNVAQDVDGASTWASASTGLTSAQGGIAVLANGDTVVGGLDGDGFNAFSISDDGGASWSVSSGQLPDFGEFADEPGWICGNEGAVIYHAGRALGGTELRVCSSVDGDNWNLIKTFTSPGAAVGDHFATNPRILMCQTTGLLVVTSTLDNGPSVAYASVDGGVTWSGPMLHATNGGVPAEAWAVANGKVFATLGARIFASDGIAKP